MLLGRHVYTQLSYNLSSALIAEVLDRLNPHCKRLQNQIPLALNKLNEAIKDQIERYLLRSLSIIIMASSTFPNY